MGSKGTGHVARKRAYLVAVEFWHGNPTAVRWDETKRCQRWWYRIASTKEYKSLYRDNFIAKRGYAKDAEKEADGWIAEKLRQYHKQLSED